MDLTASARSRVVPLAAAVIAVVAAVAFVVLRSDGGSSHPARWDPAVAELVSFVESARGRSFVHPVRVDALSDDEFAAAMGAGTGELTTADRQRVEQSLWLLRALALVTDPTDDATVVAEAASETLDGGDLARYLPAEARIVVRSPSLDELDWIGEAMVVEALGMALHDQHFGVSRASRLDRSTGTVGLRAVSAGAGAAIADGYVTGVVEGDRRAWREARDPGRGQRAADLVRGFASIPDALGEPLVQVALSDASPGEGASWRLVDELFVTPPRTELELLQPWAAIDGFERVGVPAPVPGEGEQVLAQGGFGAASLYLAMALRVDAREALASALEWAGDAHILTRDPDGRLCVQIAVVGRDGDSSDRIEGSLRAWVAAGPRDAGASVGRDARVVTLRSCDPGPRASTGIALDPATAISVPVSRTDLLAELRAGGATRDNAVCVADLVLAGIPVAALTDPDPPPEADTLYEILRRESEESCRRL
jgi:hypothetical protein